MPEQTKDSIQDLIRFVDDNFKQSGYADIFLVFPMPFILVGFMFLAFLAAIIISPNMFSAVWIPIFFSLTAFFTSFYSFVMTSRKFANKRLAAREAKRLREILTLKVDNVDCLLPPIVALKMENQPMFSLQSLYETDKTLFSKEKLLEYYKPT